jgi:hypothetical protein
MARNNGHARAFGAWKKYFVKIWQLAKKSHRISGLNRDSVSQ